MLDYKIPASLVMNKNTEYAKRAVKPNHAAESKDRVYGWVEWDSPSQRPARQEQDSRDTWLGTGSDRWLKDTGLHSLVPGTAPHTESHSFYSSEPSDSCEEHGHHSQTWGSTNPGGGHAKSQANNKQFINN